MASAPKGEKRETKLPEIGGESTAKPIFLVKTLGKKKKKHYEHKYQKTGKGIQEQTFSWRTQKPETKRNQNQDQI